jgi:hypothetical protein
MFREALRNLSLMPADHGLVDSVVDVSARHTADDADDAGSHDVVEYGNTFSVPREHYDKIQFPKDTFRRHNDLDTLAREVVELGKQSQHGFKLAMAGLVATKVKLMQGGQGAKPKSTDEVEKRGILLPPSKKSERRNEVSDKKVTAVRSSQT